MKITDSILIEQVLKQRFELLLKEKQKRLSKNPNIDNDSLWELSSKSISAKHYDEIREYMNKNHQIDYVIFNQGGNQNKIMMKLDKKNMKYIHITPNLMTMEKGIKRGF